MTKPIPAVQKWMSRRPTVVDRRVSLEQAHAIMRKEDIRHLPVMEGEKLVGIVSQRDLHLIQSLDGVDIEKVLVEDAMTAHPYAVSPEAPLDEVVAEMAERKIGSAVVLQNHKVVGVFSAVDGLRALSELLKTRLAN